MSPKRIMLTMWDICCDGLVVILLCFFGLIVVIGVGMGVGHYLLPGVKYVIMLLTLGVFLGWGVGEKWTYSFWCALAIVFLDWIEHMN